MRCWDSSLAWPRVRWRSGRACCRLPRPDQLQSPRGTAVHYGGEKSRMTRALRPLVNGPHSHRDCGHRRRSLTTPGSRTAPQGPKNVARARARVPFLSPRGRVLGRRSWLGTDTVWAICKGRTKTAFPSASKQPPHLRRPLHRCPIAAVSRATLPRFGALLCARFPWRLQSAAARHQS